MDILQQQDIDGASTIMMSNFAILRAIPEPYLPLFSMRKLPYLVAVPKKAEGKYASVQ